MLAPLRKANGAPTARQGAAARQTKTEHPSNTIGRHERQALLFTAVPAGRLWTVKAISQREVVRFGCFDNRLEALGACVLLAARAEGTVCP